MGGGDSSASSSCECCSELAPRTLACSLGDSAKRVVYTLHTHRPATQYYLLLYGGEFRDGDFTEHLANMVKDKMLAVVSTKELVRICMTHQFLRFLIGLLVWQKILCA